MAPVDSDSAPALSLVAPVRDEAESLRPLHAEVAAVFGGDRHGDWELLLVDDGSGDGSADVIRQLATEDLHVRGVLFEHGCGQSSALLAGIRAARGRVVATLDADLQMDPADLPAMLARLADCDAVVGYRVGRRDGPVRRLSSAVARAVRDRVTGEPFRDIGCSLRVLRAEAAASLPPFEGMHRFLPILLRQAGLRVVEHPVRHRPRRFGRSKYGIRNRLGRALVDLLAVRWMRSRRVDPEIREIVGKVVG